MTYSQSVPLRLAWVVLATALALALGAPLVAQAHTVVDERDPAPDSVVSTSPVLITVGTSDNFLDTGGENRGFALVARDSAGLYYGDGCVTLNERRMSATIALGDGGTYDVLYQFVSADGHTLQEGYTFKFEPQPQHSPAAGLVQPPVCGVEAGAPEPPELPAATPTPGITDGGGSENTPLTWVNGAPGIIILIVVVAGLAGAALRQKPRAD